MEVVSTTSTTNPVNMYDYLNSFIMNPMVFFIILLIIVIYYVFSSSLGNNQGFTISNSSSNYNSSSSIMGIIIVVILVLLILVNAFQYFFSINLTAYIKGLFTPETQMDIVVDHRHNNTDSSGSSSGSSGSSGSSSGSSGSSGSSSGSNGSNGNSIFEKIKDSISPQESNKFGSKLKLKKQVFNVPGNYYNYENAKAICKAYDADLATYEQLENAYNNGAEWCNYGWSANQMALFPTQLNTYNNLQKIKGHENDCGRPGINGGYIANPKVRFGVNCFGFKPKITKEEDELMKTHTPYPETLQDKEFQNKVDYWKDRVDQILLSPFNYNIWGAV
jgi:hypothetical protein